MLFLKRRAYTYIYMRCYRMRVHTIRFVILVSGEKRACEHKCLRRLFAIVGFKRGCFILCIWVGTWRFFTMWYVVLIFFYYHYTTSLSLSFAFTLPSVVHHSLSLCTFLFIYRPSLNFNFVICSILFEGLCPSMSYATICCITNECGCCYKGEGVNSRKDRIASAAIPTTPATITRSYFFFVNRCFPLGISLFLNERTYKKEKKICRTVGSPVNYTYVCNTNEWFCATTIRTQIKLRIRCRPIYRYTCNESQTERIFVRVCAWT